jgi:hypothetical protein
MRFDSRLTALAFGVLVGVGIFTVALIVVLEIWRRL